MYFKPVFELLVLRVWTLKHCDTSDLVITLDLAASLNSEATHWWHPCTTCCTPVCLLCFSFSNSWCGGKELVQQLKYCYVCLNPMSNVWFKSTLDLQSCQYLPWELAGDGSIKGKADCVPGSWLSLGTGLFVVDIWWENEWIKFSALQVK